MKRKKLAITTIGVAALAFPVVSAGAAYAHGYTEGPASRSAKCAAGEVSDCGPIQWEPQSVEGPKGFPGEGPADGSICSAGLDQFKQLDDPRGGEWPATALQAGQTVDFTWKITAQHSTTSFRYFITKDGYDPTKPLTRADLEPEPFLQKDLNGKKPSGTEVHQGALPDGKSGKHMILAVWDIADTANAFYSCADVDFGGGQAAAPAPQSKENGDAAPRSASDASDGKTSKAAEKVALKSEAKMQASGTHVHDKAPAPKAQLEGSDSAPQSTDRQGNESGGDEQAVLAGSSHDMGNGGGGADGPTLLLVGALGALVGGGIMSYRRRPVRAKHR